MPAAKPVSPVLQSNQYATGLAYFAVCYEGAGTTLHDLSASANNGTVLSGEWGTGQFSGPDLNIAGNTANVCALPAVTGFDQTGDLSVSCWAKMTATTLQFFVATYGQDVSSNTYGWVVGTDPANTGKVYWFTSSGIDNVGSELLSATVMSTGTWYHIVCTIDVATATKKIYVNGTLDATSASGQQFPNYHTSGAAAQTAAVGGASNAVFSGAVHPAIGEVDAVAVYSYLLPASSGSNDTVAGIFADPFRAVRAATTVVTFPNASVFLSPYTWRTAAGSAFNNVGGGYLIFKVTGTTTISATINVSSNLTVANDMPSLKARYSVSGGGFDSTYVTVQAATLPSTQLLALFTGLNSSLTYTVHIEAIGGQTQQDHLWDNGTGQTQLDNLTFDFGATLSAPTLRTKRALILGDSFLTAYFGGGFSGPYYQNFDWTTSWAPKVARALNAEFGLCGIGASGWLNLGTGNYPAGPGYWASLDSTHARDFTTPPDYLLVAWGTNDHHGSWTESQVQTAVSSWLAVVRAALPSAWIFVVIPFGGQAGDDSSNGGRANQVPIRAAVTAFNDAKAVLIDGGNDFAFVFSYSAASWASLDGIHPLAIWHGDLAAEIAEGVKTAMGSAVFNPIGSGFIRGI